MGAVSNLRPDLFKAVVAQVRHLLRTPEIIKGLAAKVPGAKFEQVDSGHFMHVQTPQLVADKIRAFVTAHVK